VAGLLPFALASEALGWTVDARASGVLIDAQFNQTLYQDGRASSGLPGTSPGPAEANLTAGLSVFPPSSYINAYASADLATGRLGAYAVASNLSGEQSVTASGFASFSDSLVFDMPPGMSSASITLSLAVDATSDTAPPGALYPMGGSARVQIGAVIDQVAWQDSSFGSGTSALSRVLSVTQTVQPGVPIDFGAMLQGDVSLALLVGFHEFDASRTATLSVVVPEGVTWVSGSGVLLTQIPEPGALGLMLVGVSGVIAASQLRRRRRIGDSTGGFGFR
jgi:hypothetical protein